MPDFASLADVLPPIDGIETVEPVNPPARWKEPWHKDYNPVTDATPVVRFGALWISPGRYMTPDGFVMDENAALVADDECHGCGSTPGHDVSMWVKIPTENPFERRGWIHDWTFCKVCTPSHLRASLPERRPGPR